MMVLSDASSGFTVAVMVSDSPSTNSSAVLFSSTLLTSMSFLLTVIVQVEDFPPADAIIVDVPSAMAETKPEFDTVATDSLEDVQVNDLSVASLGRTVAFN
jgi:hypothetical protein